MKKKLITILGIIIGIPLIIFMSLVVYFIVVDDTDKSKLVSINDIDVSSKLQMKEIDSIMYANAKSFIESFVSSDMGPDMRYFNYENIDKKTLYDYLSETSYNGDVFINDEFTHLIDLEAILVGSWFTDAPLYILFIDSKDVVIFTEIGDRNVITIDEAPRNIDNNIYIPMEAFAKLVELKIEIKN